MQKLPKKPRSVCRSASASLFLLSPVKVPKICFFFGVSTNHNSVWKMPTGKTQNCERWRHPLRHDISRIRKLCRGPQNLPFKISWGKLHTLLPFLPPYPVLHSHLHWDLTAFRPNQLVVKIKVILFLHLVTPLTLPTRALPYPLGRRPPLASSRVEMDKACSVVLVV